MTQIAKVSPPNKIAPAGARFDAWGFRSPLRDFDAQNQETPDPKKAARRAMDSKADTE
jgi:hypothetical protein